MIELLIRTETIDLDQLLKFAGLADPQAASGRIAAGAVRLADITPFQTTEVLSAAVPLVAAGFIKRGGEAGVTPGSRCSERRREVRDPRVDHAGFRVGDAAPNECGSRGLQQGVRNRLRIPAAANEQVVAARQAVALSTSRAGIMPPTRLLLPGNEGLYK